MSASGKLVFERIPGEMPTKKRKTPTGWPDLISERIKIGGSRHRSLTITLFDSGCSFAVITFMDLGFTIIICFLCCRRPVFVEALFWSSRWDSL